MSDEKGATYSEDVSLTDKDIHEWCKANKIPYHMVDLDKLGGFDQDMGFIYTGSNPNEHNNGNPHHWLAIVGNKVFDSYGQRDYKIPEQMQFMEHKPKQLQHWDSNVCGEYCCLLLKLAHEDPTIDENFVGQKFVNHYGYGNNQNNNDRKTLKAFTEKAPESIAGNLPEVKNTEGGGIHVIRRRRKGTPLPEIGKAEADKAPNERNGESNDSSDSDAKEPKQMESMV